MKPIRRRDLLEFDNIIDGLAAEYEVETKDDLERFSVLLHNRLELVIYDYAIYLGAEDYEQLY